MFAKSRIKYAIAAAAILALGIGIISIRGILHTRAQSVATESPSSSSPPTDSNGADENTRFVTLSDAKLKTAGIKVEPCKKGSLTQLDSVPGRVVYNDTRHIELRTPTSGILTQILVKPGDKVEAWQVLAWLNSPEIGSARADVLQRRAAAELSQRLLERAATLKENVTTLTAGLRQQTDFNSLQSQLTGHVLGAYREKLLGAYSRMQLAEKMIANSSGLGESGVLSGKIVAGYQADFLTTRAALEAACEQADLEVWQEHKQAEATAQDAERRLQIARQNLSSLLLNEAATNPETGSTEGKESGPSEDDLENLSRVAVRAPFHGTIESRMFSASERVQANDPLFVLADTSSMWISAEIRESDWPALSIDLGHTVMVSVPAIQRSDLTAVVEFIGREVSPTTNSISITARIENPDGKLRPGLFVRVAVPVSEKSNVLVVPSTAVEQHDGQKFVFVSEPANRFRRADVVIGEEGEGRVEIVKGLRENDQVVVQGAFALKSELLLESEGE